VTTEYRWAEGQFDQLPRLAGELVRRQVAAIAAFSPPAAQAAIRAAPFVPVVFTTAGDPVTEGLVASLNRPGGNATGVSFFSALIGAKRLELLRALVPKVDVVGVLLNPESQTSEDQLKSVQDGGRALGVNLQNLNVRRGEDLEMAFAPISQNKIDALMVLVDPLFSFHRKELAALAAQHKVPMISYERDFAEAGGLMSYGASLIDAYRQVGVYAGRILKGDKPAELPVLQPTKFDLVINSKTAKALGVTISDKLLALADEVIE
jgi:putative ABC transport system substrate-binding protein